MLSQGLGKTVQIVAFLAALDYSDKLPGPAIVVAPATVLKQWQRHFTLWWPRFHVRILHPSSSAWEEDGSSAKKRPRSTAPEPKLVVRDVVNAKRSVLITSYEQLRRHEDLLYDKFEYVILDEAHKIRNPDALITLSCKRFLTPRRILLTGTPMQNNLKELWSIFDFAFPGRLGTLVVFESEFSVPIAIGGYTNASRSEVYTAYRCAVTLRQLVSPYMLRRMKSDVALDLPEKQEQVLFCRLTLEQRQAYQHHLNSRSVKMALRGQANLLAAISTLRQICDHVDIATVGEEWRGPTFCRGQRDSDEEELTGRTGAVEEALDTSFGHPSRSGKLKVLETVLASWHKGGHRVLIFSQTHVVLDILARFAEKRGYVHLRMDGRTPVGKRQALIDEFNESNVFLFLLTTRTGGLGTNLVGADRVILFSPDWNPAVDLQSRERAWRIGQKKSVVIYRLVTAGTIEEKILQRQFWKSLLASKVLADARQRRIFKRKDMTDLFTLSDDKAKGTETGDLFLGTAAKEVGSGSGQESSSKERGADASRVEGKGANGMLKSLFNSSDCGNALQSAMNHDAMLQAGTREVDVAVLQHETEKIVSKAVDALNQSAAEVRRTATGVPTWTGKSGLAGIPEARPSFGRAGTGAGSLLHQIKKRAEPNNSAQGSATDGTVNELTQNVVAFLKQNEDSSSSDALIARFTGDVGIGGHSLTVFKTTLKRVAVLKKNESTWYLKAKFKE